MSENQPHLIDEADAVFQQSQVPCEFGSEEDLYKWQADHPESHHLIRVICKSCLRESACKYLEAKSVVYVERCYGCMEGDRHIEQDANIKARALKVNDPEFLLDRLADDKEALLVTRVTRKSLEGTPFLLVNKKKADDDPVQAFAVVEFEQEEGTISNLEALGRRVAAIDEESRTDFGKGGEKAGDDLYVLKLSLIRKLRSPVTLKKPPPGRRFGGDVDLNRDRLREAFHLRNTHWVPVPSSGQCPMTHPSKLKFPGTDTVRCFTPSAARVVRGQMREQIEKIDASEVNLRPKDFPTMKCAGCRYFIEGVESSQACKIVTRAEPELVCDAYQGAAPRGPTYEVSDDDWLSFVEGMVKEQPYQHIVQRGFLTPEGPIVIIADTMKPKPHIFSLSKKFHLEHTGVEHGWTQEEVDDLIKVGLEEDVIVVQESEEAFQEGIRPLFGSPGGKRFLASTIIGFIPPHKKYVEPFVGGGAIFFGKRESEKEVINDLHKGVSHAYRFAQSVSEGQIDSLKKMPLEFSRTQFFKMRDNKPTGVLPMFHRFMYLNAFSFGTDGKSTVSQEAGKSFSSMIHRFNRLPKIRERLKGVEIGSEDFRNLLTRHDAPDTFFYLDPPYPDQQGKLKTSLTNQDISNAVGKLKGKWILSLPNTASVREVFAKFHKKKVSVRRTMDMKNEHTDSELLISNFPLRASSDFRLREQVSERTGEQIAPSGLHDHPHPPNGIHTHLGSPPNSGGHEHERFPGSGAHRHRDGDPIDGFHLGDPTDEGAHVHILANREKVPELWEWYRKVVAAHFPIHQWLEGHNRTLIAEMQPDGTFSDPRESAQADWDMHGLWAMHSAGANTRQHEAVYLNPETRFFQLIYEFENGDRREATTEDFDQEIAWFDEHLPFPRAEVTKALGEDGELQESTGPIRFVGNYAGAEVSFMMREMTLDRARQFARDLVEVNPEMAISVCAGDLSSTFGPRWQIERNGYVRLRGSHVGDLFTNSRGLVANLRVIDLREVASIEGDRWAVAIEGGNRHAGFLHLPDRPSEELETIVREMATSNPDRVFHLAKATERVKSVGLIFRIAVSMDSDK